MTFLYYNGSLGFDSVRNWVDVPKYKPHTSDGWQCMAVSTKTNDTARNTLHKNTFAGTFPY